MRCIQIILLHIFLFHITACNNKPSAGNDASIKHDTISPPVINPDTLPAGQLIENVVCKNDATQSYAAYIPSGKANAVVYFFDPHADGALPLKKYKALAEAYHFILIGSNTSKNGNDFQMAENIWQHLYNDTKTRMAFNVSSIYACGFSGGAKVAGYLALRHPEIKAVIAGGAGLPDGTPAADFNFSFTGIAGKGDMNMTDLVALNNDLDKTLTRHRLILFDGKHEWCPESIMNIAFAGLQLDAIRSQIFPKNDSLINACINNSKQCMDASIKKNNYIQASDECLLAMNMLDGLADVAFFKQKNNSIVNDAAYKKQLQQQQQLFASEQNKKAEYNIQFRQGDINYWNKTISDLNEKARGATPGAAMNQRLLAYLSLAFYSISNQLINQNQNDAAGYFVTLYKLADPTNSEAWYFSAILNARNNDAKAAHDDLVKAVSNGFNDNSRMMQQPEFARLQPQINLPLIPGAAAK